VNNSEKWTYARVVNFLEDCSKINLRNKEKSGFRLPENTADEILEATKDMQSCVASTNQSHINI
jgi:hypothetical protein